MLSKFEKDRPRIEDLADQQLYRNSRLPALVQPHNAL
jgi:hypothetical protein